MELREHPVPEPGPGEIRVRVEVCGVCRTDLHVVEGDLEAQRAAQRVALAKFKGPAFASTCVDVLEEVMAMRQR